MAKRAASDINLSAVTATLQRSEIKSASLLPAARVLPHFRRKRPRRREARHHERMRTDIGWGRGYCRSICQSLVRIRRYRSRNSLFRRCSEVPFTFGTRPEGSREGGSDAGLKLDPELVRVRTGDGPGGGGGGVVGAAL